MTCEYGKSTYLSARKLMFPKRTNLHIETKTLQDLHLGADDNVLPLSVSPNCMPQMSLPTVPEELVMKSWRLKHEPFPYVLVCLLFAFLNAARAPVVRRSR